jgi:hypothetical protein
MDTSPTLVTPILGSATATSINKLTLTQPSVSATLTLDSGSTLATSGAHSITLASTADSVITLPTSGTLVSSTVTTLSSLASVGTITTGTWSGSFGAVSGANLTNLTAGNLSGTIPSTVLANSSVYVGTTQVALNRASGSLALTGISSIDGVSSGLKTSTGSVSVSSANPPNSGQALIATSSTTATWQDLPASGGSGTVTSVSLTLTSTGTDITSSVATSTTTPAITLNIPSASASNRGALSSADWSTFNGKAPLASPTFTGTPAAPTATVGTNTTQIATTAFVLANAAPLASPTFTGTPAAPTASADTNTTQLATTAFVISQASSTTPVMNGTAAIGTSLKYARADHVHASDTTKVGFATVNTVTNRISDGDGNLRSVPQNNKTAAYTLVAADNGKNINITTGGVTIPASVFVAGDIVSIYNQSDSTQTITCSAVTLYIAGTSGAKTSLTLAARGILSILYVTATEVIASGNIT